MAFKRINYWSKFRSSLLILNYNEFGDVWNAAPPSPLLLTPVADKSVS